MDEQTARAWEAEFLAESTAEEERLTLGEVVMLYYRSHPESHPRTKRNVVYFLAEHDADGKHVPGVGEFLRDKFADALTRQDLERMREGFRSRGTGNNTINKYQAYLHAILAWAVDQELISRNPWRDYKRLRVQRHLCMTTLEDFRRVYAFFPPTCNGPSRQLLHWPCDRGRSSSFPSPGMPLIGAGASSMCVRAKQGSSRPSFRQPCIWRKLPSVTRWTEAPGSIWSAIVMADGSYHIRMRGLLPARKQV